MKCKRCGCSDRQPCRQQLANGRVIPCSWVVSELCSACLTQDEQAIIASFEQGQILHAEAPSLEERREELRNVLFARLYPQFAVQSFNGGVAGNLTMERAAEVAMDYAEVGAKVILPEPTGIELVDSRDPEFQDLHLGQRGADMADLRPELPPLPWKPMARG